MNKTDNIIVRVEPKLKSKAEKMLADLGLNMADAINIYLKQIVLTESIPFKIEKPHYNAETMKVISDARRGKNMSKVYDNADKMWEDIERNDN